MLEDDIFRAAVLTGGKECWVFYSNQAQIRSETCDSLQYAACQVDCRPGN